ncbi:DNA binding HTH domain, Psq-type,Homeobox domain-like [Cinara cedri]|uniref:DNA binding HTH domain, Psq-type,Homeobox domain-like n=1 Tax=Cinara cedri TaxID=506608 RepID=A0A5E4N067_9HEMI|nr:DNA binding HTH domain, Psq-type,Homeobox domain-like [Cinara cedri]
MSLAKRVLKMLTYKEKTAAIREVENRLKTKSLIAKEFGIPLNTLSTCLKNKETILKRSREPENPEVDECIYKWF